MELFANRTKRCWIFEVISCLLVFTLLFRLSCAIISLRFLVCFDESDRNSLEKKKNGALFMMTHEFLQISKEEIRF